MTLIYVTDTHSLVWYFTDDQRLSKKALKSLIRYDACLITRDQQIAKSKMVKTIW